MTLSSARIIDELSLQSHVYLKVMYYFILRGHLGSMFTLTFTSNSRQNRAISDW